MVRCPPSPFETRFALLRVRAGFTNHAALLSMRPAPRTDSSFVIFALERILKYLVDSWVQGIGRVAVIADINRDRNAAMNVTFVAPLPKSDVSLLSADVAFAT